MEKNSPLLRKWRYPVEGLIGAARRERAFRLELLLGVVELPVLIWIEAPLYWKGVLLYSYLLLLGAELLNSGIERVVDLVTPSFHPLAKEAKDFGAGAVLLCLGGHLLLWGVTFVTHQ